MKMQCEHHPDVRDLTDCDRLGIKGRGTPLWLVGQGLALPERPNRLVVQPGGLIVARYGEGEFAFAQFDRDTGAVHDLRLALDSERPAGCYSVPRADSQVAFGLRGPVVIRALSAICPADLRPAAFGPGDVLQTLCAGVSAQLWHLPEGALAQVVVFCDSSVVRHQCAALHAAMTAASSRAQPLMKSAA